MVSFQNTTRFCPSIHLYTGLFVNLFVFCAFSCLSCGLNLHQLETNDCVFYQHIWTVLRSLINLSTRYTGLKSYATHIKMLIDDFNSIQLDYKDEVPSDRTPFLLPYFMVACFDPSVPSSGYTGAVSERNYM
jgi:hypothetical protein